MKKLLLVLALLALPAGAAAQGFQLQPTPLEEGDARLAFARPFADGLVRSDLEALTALIEKQVGGAPSEQLLAGLRTVVDDFGGDRFEVQEFLNGRGRDIVVTLVNKTDGMRRGVALVLDPETGRLTGFAPVQIQGG